MNISVIPPCLVKEIPFPKLMENTKHGFVVLMTSQNKGTVVDPQSSNHKVGYHSANWKFDELTDFEYALILEN